MIALLIGFESVVRLFHPVAIGFAQAIPIAIVGLAVNLVSVWLLHDDHHPHGHAHAHDAHGRQGRGDAHPEHHRDTNFRAAYVHVLADALTSVLAIVALLSGRFLGLTWLDPLMGLVGTVVIATWALSLIRSAGAVLLDAAPDQEIDADIRQRLELNGDRVTDLHLWQVGPGHRAAVVSIVSDRPRAPAEYKRRLAGLHNLSHVTVEVEPCPGHPAASVVG